MDQKRVLILSEAFGSGHTKAAEAIKEGLEVMNPHWDSQVIELGSWLRPKLSSFLGEIYLKTLKLSPKLWGMVYKRNKNKIIAFFINITPRNLVSVFSIFMMSSSSP